MSNLIFDGNTPNERIIALQQAGEKFQAPFGATEYTPIVRPMTAQEKKTTEYDAGARDVERLHGYIARGLINDARYKAARGSNSDMPQEHFDRLIGANTAFVLNIMVQYQTTYGIDADEAYAQAKNDVLALT